MIDSCAGNGSAFLFVSFSPSWVVFKLGKVHHELPQQGEFIFASVACTTYLLLVLTTQENGTIGNNVQYLNAALQGELA